jgi:Leucine-rich repeat (LRR) protein
MGFVMKKPTNYVEQKLMRWLPVIAGIAVPAIGASAYFEVPPPPGRSGAIASEERKWASAAVNDGSMGFQPVYNGPSCEEAVGALSRRLDRGEGGRPIVAVYLAGPFTDAQLEPLRGATAVEDLTLFGIKVTDDGLKHIAAMTGLRRLFLYRAPITDAGLAVLEGFPKLEKLDLSYTRVTDAGLAHLAGATRLRDLNLQGAPVGDAGLVHLGGLANLDTLNLRETRISDAGLEHLGNLKTLKTLRLAGIPVTDSGLKSLEGLNDLNQLEISSPRVTDAGLGHLKGLTGLRYLDLGGTKVTGAGIEDLRRALPKLKVNTSTEPPY